MEKETKFTKKLNHKEASEQGVKQTLNTRFSCRVIMLGKENGNNGQKRVFYGI
jgi:hypothetical protein